MKRQFIVPLTCLDGHGDNRSVELVWIDRIVIDPNVRQAHSGKAVVRFNSG